MASQLIVTPGGPLVGSIPVPSDQDVALCRTALGAIARGHTSLAFRGAQRSLNVFLDFLRLIGVECHVDEDTIRVSGMGLLGLVPAEKVIDLRGESHVAALALALLVSRPKSSALLVDQQVHDLLVPLLKEVHPISASPAEDGVGMQILLEAWQGEARPLGLSVGTVGVFPWVKQAVLLAGLRARTATFVEEKFASADHLERAMTRARMPLDVQGTAATLHPPRDEDAVAPQIYAPLGSAHLAAYLGAAAAMVPQSHVTLREICLNPTRSDALSVLRLLGVGTGISPRGDLQGEPYGDVTVEARSLRGLDIGGEAAIRLGDTALPLLAVAARAKGSSFFSDLVPGARGGDPRIYGRVVGLLRSAGVDATVEGSTVVVRGNDGAPLRGISTTTGGDPRLALLGTVLALGAKEPSVIDDVDCLGDEFPRWVGSLRALGAKIEVKASE